MIARRPIPVALVVVATLACSASTTAPSALTAEQLDYRDPANRFAFSYPRSFGATSIGTDNGFGNRVAAVRFSSFRARQSEAKPYSARDARLSISRRLAVCTRLRRLRKSGAR